jgi:uncharacterized protein (TIRG00374 family)
MKKALQIIKKSYVLIGIAIFVFVIKDINFTEFKEAISNIKPIYYLAAAISYLPITFIKSYRWKKILDTQNIHYSIKEVFYMLGSSSLFGLITPGRLGDFSKVAYLKQDKHSLTRAFLSSFLDKLFDVFFVIIFILIALPLLDFPFKFYLNYSHLIKYGLLAGIVGIIVLAILYNKYKEKISCIVHELWFDLKKFKIKNILSIFLITTATWFGYFTMIYLIAMSIGLHQSVSFLYMAFAAAFGIISALIPISILGIGTREISLLTLLIPIGIPKETVILFSLLITINYVSLALIYFYCYLKRPLFKE